MADKMEASNLDDTLPLISSINTGNVCSQITPYQVTTPIFTSTENGAYQHMPVVHENVLQSYSGNQRGNDITIHPFQVSSSTINQITNQNPSVIHDHLSALPVNREVFCQTLSNLGQVNAPIDVLSHGGTLLDISSSNHAQTSALHINPVTTIYSLDSSLHGTGISFSQPLTNLVNYPSSSHLPYGIHSSSKSENTEMTYKHLGQENAAFISLPIKTSEVPLSDAQAYSKIKNDNHEFVEKCLEPLNKVLYKCGGCGKIYGTVCSLHEHIQNHAAGGSYHYDHYTQTAFPKYDTTCASIQTVATDINSDMTEEMVVTEDKLEIPKMPNGSPEAINGQSNPDYEEMMKMEEVENQLKCALEINVELKSQKVKTENEDLINEKHNTILEKANKVIKTTENEAVVRKSKRKLKGKKLKKLKVSKRSGSHKIKDKETVKDEVITVQPLNVPEVGVEDITDHDNDYNDDTDIEEDFKPPVDTKKRKKKRNTPSKSKKPKPSIINLSHIKNSKPAVSDEKRKRQRDWKCMTDMTGDVLYAKIEKCDDGTEVYTVNDEPIDYMCQTCQIIFTTEYYLHNHKLRHKGQQPCDYCFKTFKDIASLEAHNCEKGYLSETADLTAETFFCQFCKVLFTEVTGMGGHICRTLKRLDDNTEVLRTYSAGDIPKMLKDLPGIDELNEKLSKNKKDPRVKCDVCLKEFSYRNNLYVHSYVHKYAYQCSLCDGYFASDVDRELHEISCASGKIFPCNLCSKRFTSMAYLNTHLMIHEGKKDHQCEKCGSSFATKWYLKSHKEVCIHGDERERKWSCEYCEKKFFDRFAVNNHMNTVHSDIKPYVCEICAASFKYACNLKKHLPIHDAERPRISCDECSSTFNSIGAYKRHKKIHRGLVSEVCTVCGKTFTDRWNLKAHMRQHTGEKPYICNVCGQGFAHNVSKKHHMQNHH